MNLKHTLTVLVIMTVFITFVGCQTSNNLDDNISMENEQESIDREITPGDNVPEDQEVVSFDSVEDFYDEYKQNEVRFFETYSDRPIQVTGTIRKLYNRRDDVIEISLIGDTAALFTTSFRFAKDDVDMDKIYEMNEGDVVTLQGYLFLEVPAIIYLDNSTIVEN